MNGIGCNRLLNYLALALVSFIVLLSVVSVKAQTVRPNIAFEAESGTLSSGIYSEPNLLASGGAFIGFTAALPPPPPPTTGGFSETFSTPAGFYDRFNRDVHYRDRPVRDQTNVWPGDHNLACEGPTTFRDVTAKTDDEVFWWCAPKGPDSGHVMTSMGDVDGYTILSFSPKQIFLRSQATRVCWDVNLTNMGGRQWTQAMVIPKTAWEANNKRLDYISLVTQDVDQTALKLPPGGFMFQNWDHKMRLYSGQTELLFDWDGFDAGNDTATRFKHCMIDNGNGTITVTQARPTGTLSRTVNASFPSEYVVIFQDDNYTPDKDGEANGHYTWHWDNIIIDKP